MKTISRKSFFGVIVYIVLLSPNLALADKKDPALNALSGQAQTGRNLFLSYCSACHGIDAKGNGPAAPALKIAPADLTKIAERRGGKFPDGEIAMYIDGRNAVSAHGTREMPIWGENFSKQAGGDSMGDEFSRGRITVLVDYIKSIQQ